LNATIVSIVDAHPFLSVHCLLPWAMPSQRSELRRKMKKAHDENIHANENLMEWEEKRINLATGKN
jgi:hypothetical protein